MVLYEKKFDVDIEQVWYLDSSNTYLLAISNAQRFIHVDSNFKLINYISKDSLTQITSQFNEDIFLSNALEHDLYNWDIVAVSFEDSLFMGHPRTSNPQTKFDCVNLNTGKVNWRTVLGYNNYYALKKLSNDSVLVVLNNKIQGVDYKTGKKLWTLKLGKKEIKFGRTAKSAKHGTKSKWNQFLPIEPFEKDSQAAMFLRDTNCFYIAAYQGLFKVSNEGNILWHLPTTFKDYDHKLIRIYGDTIIYIQNENSGGKKTSVALINKNTGEIIKSVDIPPTLGLMISCIINEKNNLLLFEKGIVTHSNQLTDKQEILLNSIELKLDSSLYFNNNFRKLNAQKTGLEEISSIYDIVAINDKKQLISDKLELLDSTQWVMPYKNQNRIELVVKIKYSDYYSYGTITEIYSYKRNSFKEKHNSPFKMFASAYFRQKDKKDIRTYYITKDDNKIISKITTTNNIFIYNNKLLLLKDKKLFIRLL